MCCIFRGRACDFPLGDVQYAIEQLQQQLQDSEQVQDDIKAEARQVTMQPPHSRLSKVVLIWPVCQRWDVACSAQQV